MRVVAKQGCVCPRQDHRDPPINDKIPAEVPDTAYYRRRIADGSLVYAAHAETAATGTKDTKNGGKK
jgi:hypothetical protein